jgi:hypothetical protein
MNQWKWESKKKYDQYGFYCNSACGPSFGKDIHVANKSNTTIDSYSKFGITYLHPHAYEYEYVTMKAETFLAGTFNFQLDEIEFFQKEWNENSNKHFYFVF